MNGLGGFSVFVLTLGAGLGSLGCADILGIEERTFAAGTPCETIADCGGNGSFCVSGRCATTPADSELCTVLEPEEHARVSDYAFADNSVVLGTMLLEGTSDDVPRVEAMRLGVDEMNRGVGIGEGRQLVMVGCDYTDGQDSLRAGLDYLARDLGATVVIGATSSSNTEAAIGHIISSDYATAFVSSFSTSPALSTISDEDLLWRTAPNDLGQAKVLANLIVAEPAVSKLAILYVNDSYGAALQEEVNDLLTVAGRQTAPLRFESDADQSAIDVLVSDLVAASADGVLLIAVDPANVLTIYQAMVDAGLSLSHHYLADAAKAEPLLDGGLSPEVVAILESALGTAPYHSTDSHYDTFENGLRAIDVDPNGTSFLAQSYDAAYLAGYGLAYAQASEAPRDGYRVVDGFMAVVEGEVIEVGRNDFPLAVDVLSGAAGTERRVDIRGTGGELDFDLTTGDAPGAYEIWQRNAGMFTTCGVCSADEDVCTIEGC